jgi:CBS-domain-containing membrane protein
MVTATKSFRSMTARDLMSREMVVIPQHSSLRHAAHLLTQARVSGAPVVDEMGRCVGVISTTDFMRWVDHEQPAEMHRPRSQACVCSDWEVVSPEILPVDEVRTYMTMDPVKVGPGTPIEELARMMLDAHIHRLIVADEEARPIGIVTTTDILAAVARSGGRPN